MKTIELKHIQHYPMGENGLKLLQDRSHWATPDKSRVVRLSGVSIDSQIYSRYGVFSIFYIVDYSTSGNDNSDTFKPILRPLSDLTKEIEVNGERFVPIDKLDELFPDYFIDLEELLYETVDFSYPIIQKLFEWHFAVDIPSEFWIDINTLD